MLRGLRGGNLGGGIFTGPISRPQTLYSPLRKRRLIRSSIQLPGQNELQDVGGNRVIGAFSNLTSAVRQRVVSSAYGSFIFCI